MIVGIGCDLVDIRRIEKLLSRFHERGRSRLFTPAEIHHGDTAPNPAASYAKRFAAKEAFSKALGTGIAEGLTWRDVEVTKDGKGKPLLRLSPHGWALLCQKDPKLTREKIQLDLSLSDEYPYAQAFVIVSHRQG